MSGVQMDITQMRAAFERTNGRDNRREPPKGNNYIDPLAQSGWESFQKGWQASRKALVVKLPFGDDPNDPDSLWAYDKARKALEAQGLKVAP